MQSEYDIIIIGAGLSGLAAAQILDEYNLNVLVLDKSDRAGGRVKTDELNGFLLDHGFQVYLTAYPEGKRFLDYNALDLKVFESGATCFSKGEKFTVRNGNGLLNKIRTGITPVGSFKDKLKVNKLKNRLSKISLEDMFNEPEMPTIDYLKKQGFSDKMINRFFKPFFGGIFLESELQTSSRMFEFVFKILAKEYAAVPAKGMEQIPKQLKNKLKKTQFRFNTQVEKIINGDVILANNERLTAKQIIVATHPGDMMDNHTDELDWVGNSTYYFSADKAPLKANRIAINYNAQSMVNSMTVLNQAVPAYAPKGKNLISVALKGISSESVENTSALIKSELGLSFGHEVSQWEFIKNYDIHHALPKPRQTAYEFPFEECRLTDQVYLAGDYLLNGSINAALKSGEMAAKAAILHHS